MKRICACFLILVLLGIFINTRFAALSNGRDFIRMTTDIAENVKFRRMNISEKNYAYLKALSQEDDEKFFSYLTSLMLVNDFDLLNRSALTFSKRKLEQIKKKQMSLREDAFLQLSASYQAVFSDMEYFPVAALPEEKNAGWSYVDSWGFERTYGGKRTHEGCDIMADINESGLYPIVSSTDGVVEKIGWLEKGGYRIGIRSPKGGYYYYAHLSSYAKDFSVGDEVKAGALLGTMGDTGYGSVGTSGKFPVHLHFGIYFDGENGNEVSVNPYYVLKIYESNTISSGFYRDFIE